MREGQLVSAMDSVMKDNPFADMRNSKQQQDCRKGKLHQNFRLPSHAALSHEHETGGPTNRVHVTFLLVKKTRQQISHSHSASPEI